MLDNLADNIYESQTLKLDKIMDNDPELKKIEKELLNEIEGDFIERDKISCLLISYGLAVREKFYKKGLNDGLYHMKTSRCTQGGIKIKSVK